MTSAVNANGGNLLAFNGFNGYMTPYLYSNKPSIFNGDYSLNSFSVCTPVFNKNSAQTVGQPAAKHETKTAKPKAHARANNHQVRSVFPTAEKLAREAATVEVLVNDAPAKPRRGFFGRMWDGIRNFFGFGSSEQQSVQTVSTPQKRGFWGGLWDGFCGCFGFGSGKTAERPSLYEPTCAQENVPLWKRPLIWLAKGLIKVGNFMEQPYTSIKNGILGKPPIGYQPSSFESTFDFIADTALQTVPFLLI